VQWCNGAVVAWYCIAVVREEEDCRCFVCLSRFIGISVVSADSVVCSDIYLGTSCLGIKLWF
jgi:hypothetical protein